MNAVLRSVVLSCCKGSQTWSCFLEHASCLLRPTIGILVASWLLILFPEIKLIERSIASL